MQFSRTITAIPFALALMAPQAALADPPVIEGAQADRAGDGWRISVTLRHPDSGWDHYADGWEVLLPDGSRVGMRELLHPHVDEQPFTRALGGVSVPEGVSELHIRARCNVDGWAEDVFVLPLD